MKFVFVYGTLLSGERANHMLEGCRCHGAATFDGDMGEVISPASGETVRTSLARLCLPGHGGFPAITVMERQEEQDNNIRIPRAYIHGEVYELPEENGREIAAALDAYEGYPRLYGRTERVVFLDRTGNPVRVWLYYMLQDMQQLENFRVIDSGSWKDREETTPYFEAVEQGVDAGGMDMMFARIPGIRRGAAIHAEIPDEPEDDEPYFDEDEPEEMEG